MVGEVLVIVVRFLFFEIIWSERVRSSFEILGIYVFEGFRGV